MGVCIGCLPNQSKLVERGMPVIDDCVICGEPGEDLKHLFLQCSYVRSCWEIANILPDATEQDTFLNWFPRAMDREFGEHMEKLGTILWGFGHNELLNCRGLDYYPGAKCVQLL